MYTWGKTRGACPPDAFRHLEVTGGGSPGNKVDEVANKPPRMQNTKASPADGY